MRLSLITLFTFAHHHTNDKFIEFNNAHPDNKSAFWEIIDHCKSKLIDLLSENLT